MASESRPAGVASVQGEAVTIAAAITAVGIPAGRLGRAVAGVKLRSTIAFNFNLGPKIGDFLKTEDAGVIFTDYTSQVTDRDISTVATLSDLDTFANDGYLLLGAEHPFGGVAVDVGAANGNASVMAVEFWNGTAWADITPTDGTANAGASLAKDGNLTWTPPATWTKTTLANRNLYWVRITFDAALDASVTIRELALLCKDAQRGYVYADESIYLPIAGEAGSLELIGGGGGTVDVTWFFGGMPVK